MTGEASNGGQPACSGSEKPNRDLFSSPVSLDRLREFVDRTKDEFRTALKSIGDSCDELAEECGTFGLEDLTEDVETVRRQVSEALEIVNRSLSAAKIAAGETNLSDLRHDLVNRLYVITEYCGELRLEAEALSNCPALDRIYTLGKYLDHLVSENLRESRLQSAAALSEEGPAGTTPSVKAGEVQTFGEVQPNRGIPLLVGSTLLVVDDEKEIREILVRQLTRLEPDCRAIEAPCGRDALRSIDETDVDVVLLDVMMPDLGGLEVLKEVRRRFSRAELPVVMVTGRREMEDILQAFHLGANDYVTKPFELPVVVSRIATQLELKRANEEVKKQSLFIRSTLGRFLTDGVVDRVLEKAVGSAGEGEKRPLTIMMTDLRGFTSLSERLAPEKVVETLNVYLGTMVPVIGQFGGTIDEIVGDGLLVLFGAPVPQEDHAARAVACAIAMQEAMRSVNHRLREGGFPEIEMGIGINTGVAVVGIIGSLDRSKYGVVGRHVNLAARIESCTVGGQILVSESTRREIGAILEVSGQSQVEAKGFEEPISLYEVEGIGGKYSRRMPKRRGSWMALAHEIPVKLAPLEGKIAGGRTIEGSISQLTRQAAEVRTPIPVAPYTNVKMQILNGEGEVLFSDLYGKIVTQEPAKEGCLTLRFTDVPYSAREYLDCLLSQSPED